MNSLFRERGWGRQHLPKGRSSVSVQKSRPEFVYGFSPVHGVSRSNVNDWPIEGFPEQEVKVDMSAIASWAKRPLMAVETDWINLAMAIYSADRFSSRRPSASFGDRYWRRSITLKVAVADPARWNALKSSILDALEFLTDDDWKLDFTQRDIMFGEETQMHFMQKACERPSWVCLFSGGLDSLAGLKHLSNQIGGKGLLISGWTNERLRCGQEQLVSRLPSQRGNSFEWLQVHYGFPKIQNSSFMESSQRSRGWMHVALGLAAVAASDHDVLDVCENGIGALNLPTEFSQTGSHTSRAVHPVFLSRIAKAASLVFDRNLGVRQAALFETKGELLHRTLTADDADLIDASFSCEIFPNYNAKQSQCGVCPSCLVRRAALRAADLPDSSARYSCDVMSHMLPSRKALGMIKMSRYVNRIESCFNDLAAPDSALWEYPEAGSYFEEASLSLNMTLDDFLSKIRLMHQSFALEWKAFSNSLPTQQRAAHLAA